MAANETPVWHQGELTIQKVVGTANHMATIGSQFIREYMPQQHRNFFTSLPMVYIGYVDSNLRINASMLFGDVGFIQSPSETELVINTQHSIGDFLKEDITIGDRIGMVGIEFHTKRRNRINAIVTDINQKYLKISVLQSYGNCPKYIQPKVFTTNKQYGDFTYEARDALSENDIKIIQQADTVFIASYFDDKKLVNNRGADMSHRGGNKGFITINDKKQLCIEDYYGNGFFNTLGNLFENPQASLLFCDWSTGNAMKLTVTTEILWNDKLYTKDELAIVTTSETTPEAKRTLCFTPNKIEIFINGLALKQIKK